MTTDFIYPTKKQQLPPYRLFVIDVIKETEPVITPEGFEFFKYLGIRVYDSDKKVHDFLMTSQENLGELYVAMAWTEDQIAFLNAFWDVDDFRMIITPEVIELQTLILNTMSTLPPEELRKKAMKN